MVNDDDDEVEVVENTENAEEEAEGTGDIINITPLAPVEHKKEEKRFNDGLTIPEREKRRIEAARKKSRDERRDRMETARKKYRGLGG